MGTAISILTGLVEMINAGDITKISFLTYGIFMFFTVRIGYASYGVSKSQINYSVSKMGWFVSNILMTLGIIGTVIGLIYALATSFTGIDQAITRQ